MEDLLPKLSDHLKNSIKMEKNKDKLSIKLEIINKELLPGDLGKPFEIQEMIRVFGGLKKEIAMEIEVEEERRIIIIKLLNKEDFEEVSSAMENIWDRASELLIKAFNAEPGKIEEFRELGDFIEDY